MFEPCEVEIKLQDNTTVSTKRNVKATLLFVVEMKTKQQTSSLTLPNLYLACIIWSGMGHICTDKIGLEIGLDLSWHGWAKH